MTPPGYEQKFAEFIRMCADAKRGKMDVIIVAYPWVLGDTYEEIIESLSRIAETGKHLAIAERAPKK